jgi:hypothetical protein
MLGLDPGNESFARICVIEKNAAFFVSARFGQILLSTTFQNGEKLPKNHKIYQMATNYSK